MSALVKVGDLYLIERFLRYGGTLDTSYEKRIVKVTPKRAYFDRGEWFTLDDPKRNITPRYCEMPTRATPIDEAARGVPGDRGQR